MESDGRIAARLVLAIIIKYGKTGIGSYLGDDLFPLIKNTFSELHKNNLPEEYFLFALISRSHREITNLPQKPEISQDISIQDILAEFRESEEYSVDPRVREIDDFRQQAVLGDFVYYLSKLFFYEGDIGGKIIERIREPG